MMTSFVIAGSMVQHAGYDGELAATVIRACFRALVMLSMRLPARHQAVCTFCQCMLLGKPGLSGHRRQASGVGPWMSGDGVIY